VGRASTYIQEPPFLLEVTGRADLAEPISAPAAGGAGRFGDHRPHFAGRFDRQGQPGGPVPDRRGVAPRDFNSYGSRRGNDRVMIRGTFANIRIRNQLAREPKAA
jgi:aconitate hydratase